MIVLILLLALFTLISPIGAIPFDIYFLFLISPKYKKYIMLLLSISFGVILFNIIPNESMDLYRYFININLMRVSNISYWSLWSSSDPLTYSILYVVSKTSNNHFLPFISIIIFYFFYYRSIDKFLKYFELGIKEYNKSVFFILSFIIIVGTGTGVRFALAIALLMNGIVSSEKNNNKIVTILWFLVAILSHTTLAIPIIIYLIFKFQNKKPNYYVYIITSLILFVPSLITKIVTIFSKIPLLGDLITKLDYYYYINIPWGPWYIFRLIVFFLNIYLLLKSQKFINNKEIKAIIILENFLALIGIVLLPYYYISIRFINIFNNLIIFLMIYNWKKKENTKLINLILCTIFVLFGIYQFQLFTENYYGGLTFFGWFQNIFTLLS